MGWNPTIDGTAIKEPHDLSRKWFKLSKSGRSASGRMNMDVIARKKRFEIKYKVLSGTDLNTILDILQSDASFFNLEFNHNGEKESVVVYVGGITADKFRTDGVWYWKNVTFNLIEQ